MTKEIPQKVTIQRNVVVLAAVFCSCAFSQSENLEHGKVEIRVSGGGVNAGNILVSQPAFAAGVEGAIGLNRIVSVTGDYVFDHLGTTDSSFCSSSGCSQSHQSQKMHEFMGGFRFSIPNRSRITPYGAVSAGGVALNDKFNFTSPGFNSAGSNSQTKFAFALGAGSQLSNQPANRDQRRCPRRSGQLRLQLDTRMDRSHHRRFLLPVLSSEVYKGLAGPL